MLALKVLELTFKVLELALKVLEACTCISYKQVRSRKKRKLSVERKPQEERVFCIY